jgi:hypothetical protein
MKSAHIRQIIYTYIVNNKKSALCKHVPCNTLTHSTNEDFLNIKCKGEPEVSYVRYHWNPEPVCNKHNLFKGEAYLMIMTIKRDECLLKYRWKLKKKMFVNLDLFRTPF